MPRLPKDFAISSVFVDREPDGRLIPTGKGSAVPADFRAHFHLARPATAVSVAIHVDADAGPRVYEMSVKGTRASPVTTGLVRQVLVDQLLAAALAEAQLDFNPDELVQAAIGSRPASRHEGVGDSYAATAAEIYAGAVAAGNPAPAVLVATCMGRSRSQVARYIRRARKLGLLPPLRRVAVTSP